MSKIAAQYWKSAVESLSLRGINGRLCGIHESLIDWIRKMGVAGRIRTISGAELLAFESE
jgi:hypothetical protein